MLMFKSQILAEWVARVLTANALKSVSCDTVCWALNTYAENQKICFMCTFIFIDIVMFEVKIKIKKQSVFLSGQESWGSVYMPT
jgi:hypothetical protein